MMHDTRVTETGNNLEISVHGDLIHRNAFPAFAFVTILGLVLGTFVTFAGGLPYKWVFVLAAAGCFPLLVVGIGSLEKALVALLIFSLSTAMDVHPGFSDKYATLQPGIPISLTAVLLLALYMLWLFDPRKRSRSIRLFPWVTIPFGLLALWSGLSFLWAAKPSYVLSQFPRALEAFLLFFYAANFLKSKEDIRFVLKCMAVTVALSGLLGICQYTSGDSFNLQFMGGRQAQLQIDGYVGISRVSGFLGHANVFARFLGCFLPLLLISGVSLDKFPLRSLYLISFALGLMSLILTYSRGAWLAIIFSLVLIASFLTTKKGRKKFRGVLVRILLLSLVSIIIILPFSPKIITRLTRDDYGAAYSRIPLAQTALKIIRQNPLTGIGLGNYSYVVPNYDPDPIVNKDSGPLSVHNIYLHVASELGIPALSLLLWVLVAFFARGISALKSADQIIRVLALGLVAGLAGLCLHGMFEPSNLGHPSFLVLSFVGGLLVALGQSVKQERPTLLTGGKQ